jgi:glycosyltransferase 2 family protein
MRGVRLAFLVATVGVSVYAVAVRWDEISTHLHEIGATRGLLCVPPMLAGLYCGMQAWRALLGGLGSHLRSGDASRIYFVGQLGKYLPGSVWPFLAQMELGRDHDIPRRRSASALLVALVLSLGTGLILTAVTVPLVDGRRYAGAWWLLAPAGLLALLLRPRVLLACLRRMPVLKLGPALPESMPGAAMAAATAWTMAGWLCYGLHVAVLAAAFPTRGLPSLAVASLGAYPLAWAAGLVAVVLPAGAGARDVTLILVLSGVVSTNPAIAVAVVSRAVTTGCDLALAGAAVATVGAVVRQRVSAAARSRRAAATAEDG